MNNTLCLVIDDMPDQAELISTILEDEGFEEIRVYSNPHILLDELALMTKSVLLVTDFMMPEMNGITLISKAKAIRDIEAIIVTGETNLAEKTDVLVIVKGQERFVEKLSQTAKKVCSPKLFQNS